MKRAFIALVLLCAANSAFAGTLSTAAVGSFISYNGGVYLDLTPAAGTPLRVYSFDTRVGTGAAGSPVSLYIYTCNTGSYVSNDATAANWTLVDVINTYSNGTTALTRFKLNNPLSLPAGVTRGILLWSPNGARYSGTSTTTPQQTFSNASITLFSERVRNALFGGTATTPRTFAGNVNYTRASEIEAAGAIEPYFVAQGCSTLLTVTAFPASTPASTGIGVTADLSTLNGSATQQLFDNGTNGDAIAGDNIFSFLAPVPGAVGTGLKAVPFTVTDQNNTYNSNLSVNLNVETQQRGLSMTLPRGNYDTGGAAGINTLIRDLNAPRTAQMAIAADELKTIPIGARIHAMSFRFYGDATNPAGTWPTADLHYAHYDVALSRLPSGVTVANMSPSNFATNIDTASRVVVRSGPMTILANSFAGGATQPAVNPWNDVIIEFATPYVYNGGDLVITVSHDGSDAAGTRFLDAIATTHAGYGTRYRCISANAYNATTGGALASMTILRIKYNFGLSGAGSMTPSTIEQGCSALITVAVTPGTNPASTGTSVTANLTNLGGFPNTVLHDDGQNGDATAGDNIYSYMHTVPLFQNPGTFTLPIVVQDQQCRIDDLILTSRIVAPLSGIATSTPADVEAGCQALLQVAVTPAICSTSTGIAVHADLSSIGGSSNQTFYDDGSHGDLTPNDRIYSFRYTIPGNVLVAPYMAQVTVTDDQSHADFPQCPVHVVSPFRHAVAAAAPVRANVGQQVKVTLNLNLSSCGISTNPVVLGNFAEVGGLAGQPLLDNGVPPDAVAGDKVFTAAVTIPAPPCTNYQIPLTAQDDQGHFDVFNAVLLVNPQTGPTLFDGGPLVTHPGGGAGGFDLSALQNTVTADIPIPMNILGNGGPAPNRIADDFVICDPAGWNISSITVYCYQTGSTLSSSITTVTMRIWNGVPGEPGSQIVFGDTTTNRISSTCWTGIYRATLTDPLGATRPIMASDLAVNMVLPPGRYWIDYSATGSVASGPFSPPVTRLGRPHTGNSMISTDGITYAAVIDTGTTALANYRSGLPFVVHGTANAFVRGDMDCNGLVNGRDLFPFTGVLTGNDTNPSHLFIADVNQDGVTNIDDIAAMTSLLLN